MFRDLYRVRTFYVDPSAAGLSAEMRAAGLTVTAANNSVTEGIQAVKARLARAGDGKPRLYVSPECANLLAEFESYVWRDRRGGLRDEPVKENDHSLDSLRYALMGERRASGGSSQTSYLR
jgi:phage terminase large subunit